MFLEEQVKFLVQPSTISSTVIVYRSQGKMEPVTEGVFCPPFSARFHLKYIIYPADIFTSPSLRLSRGLSGAFCIQGDRAIVCAT